MANLILKEGSSKSKSANLSLQYALLSATIALIGLLVLQVTGRADKISALNALIFVASGDGSLVFLVKWWYTKKKYETTYLFSFIIVQWLYIIISLVSIAMINLF